MSRKGHRDGGKFKGKHTTVIDKACKLLDELVRFDVVTGIVITIIKQRKGVNPLPKLDYRDSISGIELRVHSNRSVQTFYIHVNTKQRHIIEEFLDNYF